MTQGGGGLRANELIVEFNEDDDGLYSDRQKKRMP